MPDVTAAPIVRIVDIYKSFGSVLVLQGVSLDIARGEVACIIGPSGSGKSTLLRCINALVPIAGTPLADSAPIDGLEFVRTVAVARIVCPTSMVRLSAGRETMSREMQALCFTAGANSIFVGGRLLTTPNPGADSDQALFARLGLSPAPTGMAADHA